jgi:aconitase A
MSCHTTRADGIRGREVSVPMRIEMPKEADYFRHGGILQHVLGQLLASAT